jgi:general secretion pathway protein F
MPQFSYNARDRAGKAVAATLEAPSRRDALRMLSARGLQVAAITEAAGATLRPAPDQNAAGGRRAKLSLRRRATPPTRGDRLPFLQALYDLMTSGLSAGESVRLLSLRIKEPTLKTLCGGLWEKLSEGATLSRAMGEYPEVFDSSTINLIQAGEATGSLNETVSRLIAHFTEQRELRRQVLAALAYPVLMVFVAGLVILFFLFFLLPRLQTLLSSLGGKMPTSTQVLIGVSQFAIHYGWLVAIIFVAVGLWVAWWRATESGRAVTDSWLIKLPLVGPFVVSQTVLAFSQTLSVLLENGITAAEALRMTERQISNRVHRAAFDTATARVLEGEALSSALTRTGCFPDLVLDRIAIGENTGNIVPSLKDVSRNYQKNISNQLNVFTRILTTTVLLSVFVFVGFIAFAIVSAVFQLSASFSK